MSPHVQYKVAWNHGPWSRHGKNPTQLRIALQICRPQNLMRRSSNKDIAQIHSREWKITKHNEKQGLVDQTFYSEENCLVQNRLVVLIVCTLLQWRRGRGERADQDSQIHIFIVKCYLWL